MTASPAIGWADVFLSTSTSPVVEPQVAPDRGLAKVDLELRLEGLLGDEGVTLRAESGQRTRLPRGGLRYSRPWLDALPVSPGGSEWECMTEALYFEARGETVKGQFAVAEVILNRVDSARYPDTICGVVNQGTGRKYQCQFTFTCDGHAEKVHEPRAWERVGKVARLMLDGGARTLTGGATHYHTTAVNPRWARVYPRTATIGVHHFYRGPSS
ncbi:MAG: cell wall hydrolase [Pseudomonadota bacterium]